MKPWQKYWLYTAAIFFSIHLVRDIMQDAGIHNFLSDTLVKLDISKTPIWYWQVFSTYGFEISEIILIAYCLAKKKFGIPGYLSIFIALFFLIVWLFYWIFL